MGQTIAFVAGSGGVGASCLAVATAVRAAAAGRGVALVDLDPWSGGLDAVLGLEQEPGWRWDQLTAAAGVVAGGDLAARLPATDGVAVLAMAREPSVEVDPLWGGPAGAVLRGLGAAHDLTVVDVGRDDGALATALPLCDAAVVVLGSQVHQLASAAVALRRVRPHVPDPWVVLRGGADSEDLLDVVEDELDVTTVGRLPDDRRMERGLSEGLPPGARGRGPVVDVADDLLLRLASVTSPVAAASS